MKLFFTSLLSTAFSSNLYTRTIYTLNPAGANQLNDILGNSTALDASNFYDFMKSKWNAPTVEPIYKNGVIDNISDLIPHEVIVVPELITIHTSQKRGSQYDYNRQETSAVNPLPVTVKPAEDSVFIYAYNEHGKLIYPIARIPNNDSSEYTSIYSIKVFQEHSNLTSFFRPIVTNKDIDVTGVYSKDRPNMNPPNALMFRGRIAGRYSFTLAVQFNEEFLAKTTPNDVKELARKVTTKTVEVNVVDGPETIDNLLFSSSKELGLQDPKKDLGFTIKEGSDFDVSLSGRKIRKTWSEDSRSYQNDGSLSVMLKQANWNYSNDDQKPAAPYGTDLIFIQKITSDGTSVRIVANNLPAAMTEGKGTITIETHGRRFSINARVVK